MNPNHKVWYRATIFVALFFAVQYSFPQGGWTTLAPMPTAVQGPSIGIIDGKLYVASGCCLDFNAPPFPRFNTLEVYDPVANNWTTKAPIPIALYAAPSGITSIGEKLYVAGGAADQAHGNNISTLQIYDATADSWTTGASLPAAGNGAFGGIINGKLYVAGGQDPANIFPVSTVQVYDPTTNIWTPLVPLPSARSGGGSAVIDGILYAVGGAVSVNFAAVPVNTVESYNPATNTWTTLASMPTARYALGVGTIGGILYAVGGFDGSNVLDVVEAYNPATDTWTQMNPMPSATLDPGVGTINGTLYVVGGSTSPSNPTATVQAFKPSCASEPCILTPQDGVSPVSHFVALSGTGVPGDSLAVLINNAPVGFVTVGSDGTWEALPDLSFEGSSVQVQVLDQASLDASNTITVFPQTGGLPSGPSTLNRTRLLPLRHADIFVGSSRLSPQRVLYGPHWTHAALYLGGDSNGTPMVAEAVTSGETDASGQQVRSVSLESSLLWSERRIIGFELRNQLINANRDAVVHWVSTVTNRGLPYWSTSELAEPVEAALDWDVLGPTSSRFANDLTAINALKDATSQFICSTLVWAAYWNGTGGTVDISDPNNMTIQGLSLLNGLTFIQGKRSRELFIDALRPVIVVPETFARSPKLKQIF